MKITKAIFYLLITIFFFCCTPKYEGVFYNQNISTYLDLSKDGNCYFLNGKNYAYGNCQFSNDSLILDFDDWEWSLPDSVYHYSPCSTDSVFFNIVNCSDVGYRLNIHIRDVKQNKEFVRGYMVKLFPSDSLQYSSSIDSSLLIMVIPSDGIGSQKIIDKPGCYTINFYSPYPALRKIGYKKLSYKVVELKKDTIEIVYYYGSMYVGNRKLIRLSDEENKKFLQWKPLKE